jgi:hypothetical protein
MENHHEEAIPRCGGDRCWPTTRSTAQSSCRGVRWDPSELDIDKDWKGKTSHIFLKGAPGSFPVLAGGIPAILPRAHQPVVPLCRLLLRLIGLCAVNLLPGEPDASFNASWGFGSKTLLSVGNTRNLTPDIEILTCRRARSGIRASTSNEENRSGGQALKHI